MNTPARQPFTVEIQELEHDLLEMGSLAEGMVAQAVEALVNLDVNLARAVIERDDEIDIRDLKIESRCLRLLALQQPMAGDLRVIGTAMKMITDIERIGDLAVDIAKIGLKVEKEFGHTVKVDLPHMASIARSMVREALEAFVRQDLGRVRLIEEQEHQVDQCYRDFRNQIFDGMKEDPSNVVSDGWMLLVIHHIERIADHAVNIAERVSFMVTGEFRQLALPDGLTESGTLVSEDMGEERNILP